MVAFMCLIGTVDPIFAQPMDDFVSGSAPSGLLSADSTVARTTSATLASQRLKSLGVAPTRAQVVSLYQIDYLAGNTPPSIGWTGNVASCDPGSISLAYQQAMIDRVNVFRRMARLGTVNLYDAAQDKDEKTQAAALLFVANNTLSHFPPNTWTCYPQSYSGSTVGALGASGAANSNITLSTGNLSATPAAIDGFMTDAGANNTSAGHRGNILEPRKSLMAVGAVPSVAGAPAASSLWVLDLVDPAAEQGASSAPDGVAWPPNGYVPYQLLPALSNRWSFHYPNANFGTATVSMTTNGVTFAPTSYDHRSSPGCPVGFSCLPDDAIVWLPPVDVTGANGVSYASPGSVDKVYAITIANVFVNGSATPTTFNYNVTVIDPDIAPPVSISGSAQLAAGGNVADGVALCASPAAGVSCSTVSGGSFSCNVPSGWSGTLHLQAGNTKRVAARRFSNVNASIPGSNFSVFAADAAAPNFAFPCNLDVDNNGLNEPEIDGLMIMRRALGYSDAAVPAPTVGACAQRTVPTDQTAFLAAQNYSFGTNLAATSSAMVLTRLMQGISGSTATSGTGLVWGSIQGPLNVACGEQY